MLHSSKLQEGPRDRQAYLRRKSKEGHFSLWTKSSDWPRVNGARWKLVPGTRCRLKISFCLQSIKKKFLSRRVLGVADSSSLWILPSLDNTQPIRGQLIINHDPKIRKQIVSMLKLLFLAQWSMVTGFFFFFLMIVNTSRRVCWFNLANVKFEVSVDNQKEMSRKCLDAYGGNMCCWHGYGNHEYKCGCVCAWNHTI